MKQEREGGFLKRYLQVSEKEDLVGGWPKDHREFIIVRGVGLWTHADSG